MGWKQRKPGDILKWAEGVTVEGKYLGWRPITVNGKESYLVDFLVREDGAGREHKITYGCPVILKSLVDDLGLDTPIRVVCKGKQRTSSGQEAWAFDVFEGGEGEGFDEDIPF